MIKKRRYPTLLTRIPNGPLNNAVAIYVTVITSPAVVWVKQKRFWNSLLALSRKGMYWVIVNVHRMETIQKVLLSSRISDNLTFSCFDSAVSNEY
jgi:hypothetical protein